MIRLSILIHIYALEYIILHFGNYERDGQSFKKVDFKDSFAILSKLFIHARFCQNSSLMHFLEIIYRRKIEYQRSGVKPVILLQIDSRFGLAARAPKFN